MTKPQVFTVVFFALLLLLLYQIALMFRPFLFPVLWAALLAHLTYPLHVRFTSCVRGREAVSASCLTLLVLALVVVPISMMGVLFQFQLNKPIIMSLAVSEVTYGTTGTWA